MADSGYMVSLSTLICKEHETCFDVQETEEEEEEEENAKVMLCEEDSDEYVEMLLNRESCFCSATPDAAAGNSVNSARSDAVRWILRTKAFFGFSMKTAYVAVIYLDHFFMHRTTDSIKGKSWAIRLLSVACLSLAVKMEERKVPALSEFQTEDYRFDTEAIQRMELLVLGTLEWRMSMVTPFSYLSHFASKLQQHASEGVLWKAIKLVFASIEVMNLVDYRASVIAAAAVLAASDEGLTQKSVKSKMSTVSSCRSLDTDHVFSCYSLLIHETQKEKLKTSKGLAPPDHSVADGLSVDSSVDTDGTISFVVASSKRRRLQ
ncbi:cyclin-D5-2-like isoform X1 [Musa acuminata AAA Group]|uniref:cyclin-D5-2-like isoform X1 n=1 Tax=Musa acuminata AAA Group TaxID=214697 RepID=UPI0031D43D23